MSGGELSWMRDYKPTNTRWEQRERVTIGLSEVFLGENGRELGFVRESAQLIESIGYNYVWLPEHVVFFETFESKYPYGQTGAAEISRTRKEEGNTGTRGIMDGPIVAVAAAAVTSSLRFGTFIVILPQRNPVVFGREIATVDQLTGGRFDLGVGVGWLKEEYEACGVPFDNRGDRLDDYIDALRALWTQEVSSYESPTVSFKPLLAYPKPLQKPHPPILVGGQSLRGIDRAARLGDGLIVYDLDINQIAKVIDVYDQRLARYGRKLSDVRLVVGRRNEGRTAESWKSDQEFVAAVKQLGGVTDIVCSPRFPNANYEANMREYAKYVTSA
jgi:probable F420-dependent oxidoreductase